MYLLQSAFLVAIKAQIQCTDRVSPSVVSYTDGDLQIMALGEYGAGLMIAGSAVMLNQAQMQLPFLQKWTRKHCKRQTFFRFSSLLQWTQWRWRQLSSLDLQLKGRSSSWQARNMRHSCIEMRMASTRRSTSWRKAWCTRTLRTRQGWRSTRRGWGWCGRCTGRGARTRTCAWRTRRGR